MDFHPLRISIEEELHARPFPVLDRSCSVAFLAIKLPTTATKRSKSVDLAYTNAFLNIMVKPR